MRRLAVEFGKEVRFTYVMGGLAREVQDGAQHACTSLDASAASAMPVDPRVWLERPPRSTYPACQAVKAAGEQGLDGPLLRVLREGFMLRRAALDTADALVAAAREVRGLDLARFAIDLRSHAIVELFGADLDRAAAWAPDGAERAALPTVVIGDRVLRGVWELEPLRTALLDAGAVSSGDTPGVEAALRRFGAMTTAEVAAVCALPLPRAASELWRLAGEWAVRHERVLASSLWLPA